MFSNFKSRFPWLVLKLTHTTLTRISDFRHSLPIETEVHNGKAISSVTRSERSFEKEPWQATDSTRRSRWLRDRSGVDTADHVQTTCSTREGIDHIPILHPALSRHTKKRSLSLFGRSKEKIRNWRTMQTVQKRL